ncbi:MAG: 5-oxoprolinase subunit PxpB [Limisphaerales bacterium]
MIQHVQAFGPHALLARLSNHAEDEAFPQLQRLLRHFLSHPPAGLAEVTPGFATLLFEFEAGHRPDPAEFHATLQHLLTPTSAGSAPRRLVEIPVCYDGPDLARVAARGGMDISEVVRVHSAVTYRVQILGFSPGFPYLAGLDRRLHTPRLATPRTTVPAGSVAIGGEHTGVYPVATAGGWNLIGHTTVALLDPAKAALADASAFLLHPGDAVRFIPITLP